MGLAARGEEIVMTSDGVTLILSVSERYTECKNGLVCTETKIRIICMLLSI